MVGDVRVRGPERESEPQVYVPYRQINDGLMPFYASSGRFRATNARSLSNGGQLQPTLT